MSRLPSLKLSRYLVSPRQILRWIVSLDDTPQQIALGTAIGMFIGLTPTLGLQMILVLMVAPFLRFNRIAALATVYVSNPVTALPIYYFNYKVGTLFFSDTVTYAQFAEVLTSGWQEAIRGIVMEIGLPLLVGSGVVAVIGGLLTYPLTMWLVTMLRRNSQQQARAA